MQDCCSCGPSPWGPPAPRPPAVAAERPRDTPLDQYVQQPDVNYSWRIVATSDTDAVRTVVVDMVSQHWLTADDVDRTEWRHWLVLSIPSRATSDVAMLFIGGGSNGREPPSGSNERMQAIASASGTVVAELGMVPTSP